jgi:hypothetical protein
MHLLLTGVFKSESNRDGTITVQAILAYLDSDTAGNSSYLSPLQVSNLLSLFDRASQSQRQRMLAIVARFGNKQTIRLLSALQWRHRRDIDCVEQLENCVREIEENMALSDRQTMLRPSMGDGPELLRPAISKRNEVPQDQELIRPICSENDLSNNLSS